MLLETGCARLVYEAPPPTPAPPASCSSVCYLLQGNNPFKRGDNDSHGLMLTSGLIGTNKCMEHWWLHVIVGQCGVTSTFSQIY